MSDGGEAVSHVMTVRGAVAPEAIGVTLGHEHLLFDLRCLWEPPPPEREHLVDAEPTLGNRGELARDPYHSRRNLVVDEEEAVAEELARFVDAGGSAVVELTTAGLGPRPEGLRAIAARTGLHVIAGCGYYRCRCLGARDLALSTGAIEEELARALAAGVAGSDVRAGVIGELGTSSPLHPFEERQLEAAARVQRRTGAAIHVHPAIWSREHLGILERLEAAGADLGRVVLSHCDELIDPEWHARIAERGAVLSFDTFGSEFAFDVEGAEEPRDSERIGCLLRLLERGRGGQIALSHDVCTRLQLRRYGGWGYDHLLRTIVPRLRRAGVSSDELETMLVRTPRRLLTLPGNGGA